MRSIIRRPMARSSDVSQALATLQARWGGAAPRRGDELGLGTRTAPARETEGALAPAGPPPAPPAGETEGALARAVQPLEAPDDDTTPGLHPVPGPGPLVPGPARRGAP